MTALHSCQEISQTQSDTTSVLNRATVGNCGNGKKTATLQKKTLCQINFFHCGEMLLLLWHHLPSKKRYRVAQLADNPPKLLCTDKASLTWQPGSHNNLDSLDTYLDLKRQGQSSQSHISSRVNLQHTISTWIDVTLSRIGRQITDSLGVIIVGFGIILLEIKSIALLFEAFCFPALKVGDTTG